MPSLKFKLGTEVRRVNLNKEHLTFAGLVAHSKVLFPSISGISTISFTWIDDDGDMVTCSTDDEVTEAVAIMTEMQKTLTFHLDVNCNGEFEIHKW